MNGKKKALSKNIGYTFLLRNYRYVNVKLVGLYVCLVGLCLANNISKFVHTRLPLFRHVFSLHMDLVSNCELHHTLRKKLGLLGIFSF